MKEIARILEKLAGEYLIAIWRTLSSSRVIPGSGEPWFEPISLEAMRDGSRGNSGRCASTGCDQMGGPDQQKHLNGGYNEDHRFCGPGSGRGGLEDRRDWVWLVVMGCHRQEAARLPGPTDQNLAG